MEEIERKARSGKPGLRGLTEADMASILDELAIASSASSSTLGSKEERIDTEVIIGEGRNLRFPLLLRHPIFLDNNRMANVNNFVRIALAYGGSIQKTAINIGEGMLPEEEKIAKKFKSDFILQWSPVRIGIDPNTIASVKAIVIDLGSNFRRMYTRDEILDKVQGKGGLIGAKTLGPKNHLDLENAEDLKNHVELLREGTSYNIPIITKISQKDVYEDTKMAIEADSDAVIIDTSFRPFSTLSSENGTFGASLLGSIPPALKAFKTIKARKKGVKLLISGGFRDGADIVKVLAMGVDAVGIVEPATVAMGCNLCGECYSGKCKKGIATGDQNLKANFKWKLAGKKLANYLKATKKEIEILTDFAGVNNVRDLSGKNIIALTYDAAAITGVKLVGYDRELPMWFH